eukprot:3077899-Pyramimonas_sp.AAC.1
MMIAMVDHMGSVVLGGASGRVGRFVGDFGGDADADAGRAGGTGEGHGHTHARGDDVGVDLNDHK